jgi:hypothetical protein
VVSPCLAGEQLISGNCFISSQGDQIMLDHCPSFDGNTCQEAGNIMRCSMASTAPLGPQLRCLRPLPADQLARAARGSLARVLPAVPSDPRVPSEPPESRSRCLCSAQRRRTTARVRHLANPK